METKRTMFANVFYIKEGDELVGIRENPGEYQQDFYVGDVVNVSDDGYGYICPGIKTPGIGVIAGVREDDTDHFFCIEMANGEFGYCKSARLEVISNPQLSPEIRAAFEHARNEQVRYQSLRQRRSKVS